jgi:hypothetical protein
MVLPSTETLTSPGVLGAVASLGGGVALTLLDYVVGLLLLGVGLIWVGLLMGRGANPPDAE